MHQYFVIMVRLVMDADNSKKMEKCGPGPASSWWRKSLAGLEGNALSDQAAGSAFLLTAAALAASACLRAARKRCWAPCLVSP